MKFTSNITCIFAIVAQIFLSSLAFSHDVTCQASQLENSVEIKGVVHELGHGEGCGCHSSDDVVFDTSFSDSSELVNRAPQSPCTCSADLKSAYIAEEYSVERKEKAIALSPVPVCELIATFNFIPDTESIDMSPCWYSRIALEYRTFCLSQYSGRFVSTHYSKYSL